MKRVLGYAAALIAALSLAGVAASSAHADGGAANAASGVSSSVSSDNYQASFSFDNGGDNATPTATSVASSSSSAASSSAAESSKPQKPAKKPAKTVSSAKKMRGRLHYRKDSRTVLFQKGRKGAEVVLRNRKGQLVKKFKIKKSGKFSIKLTKKEAEKLGKYGKYFTFTVSEKGYKTYTIKYTIFK